MLVLVAPPLSVVSVFKQHNVVSFHIILPFTKHEYEEDSLYMLYFPIVM